MVEQELLCLSGLPVRENATPVQQNAAPMNQNTDRVQQNPGMRHSASLPQENVCINPYYS